MKVDISKDLSTLTTVNRSVFSKLESKIIWCINNCIDESIKNKDNNAEIDLGFGILTVYFNNEEIRYRFVPSQTLEKAVIDTVVNEHNDLVLNIESSLVSKLTNVYKTLL